MEASLRWDWSRELTGYVGAAFNDARYSGFETPTQNLGGQYFERAPRRQLNAGLRWRSTGGLAANVEATCQGASNSEYQSQTDSSAPDFGQVIGVRCGDAATLVNAGVQYRFGRWTASASVKNLLDRDYVVSRPSGTVVTAGAPRSFGASLRFDL